MSHAPQEEFWIWFAQHQAKLFDFETDQERLFDQLATQLQKVQPNLTFEFGPKDGGKREFVISAGGIKAAFPAVVFLADVAPALDQWRVTAFRPRRTPINIVELEGKCVAPDNVQFSLLDNGTSAGIYLFIPGLREGDIVFKQIGYLLLDDALGEYDVETRLGLIKMFSPDTITNGDRYPLAELPALFDQWWPGWRGAPAAPRKSADYPNLPRVTFPYPAPATLQCGDAPSLTPPQPSSSSAQSFW